MSEQVSIDNIDSLLKELKKSPLANIKHTDLEINHLINTLAHHDAKKLSESIRNKIIFWQEIESIINQWQSWKNRAAVYKPSNINLDDSAANKKTLQAFDNYYQEFQHLNNSSRVKKILRKINLALLAFKEQPTSAINDEAKLVILAVLHIELKKLHIIQLEALEKRQQYRLNQIQIERQKLNENKLIVSNAIKKRATRFSNEMKNKKFSYKFFRLRENRIHFNRHIDKAEKMGLIAQTISSTLTKIGGSIHAICHVLAPLLAGLALVTPIAVILPLLANTIKAWVKFKDASTIATATGITMGVIAAIAMAGSFPFATAFIVAGLIFTGTVVESYFPWLELVYERVNRLKIVKLCNIEIKQIKPNHDLPLSGLQKQVLLIKLEEIVMETLLTEKNALSLQEVRRAIFMGNKDTIVNNPWIQKLMLGINEQNFDKFMKKELLIYKGVMLQDIASLKRESMAANMALIGGTMAIISGLLFCVPTPVTAVAGFCLFLASSIIAISIKFKLIDKLWDRFAKPTNSVVALSQSFTTSKILSLINKNVKLTKVDLTPQVYPPVLSTKKEADIDPENVTPYSGPSRPLELKSCHNFRLNN